MHESLTPLDRLPFCQPIVLPPVFGFLKETDPDAGQKGPLGIDFFNRVAVPTGSFWGGFHTGMYPINIAVFGAALRVVVADVHDKRGKGGATLHNLKNQNIFNLSHGQCIKVPSKVALGMKAAGDCSLITWSGATPFAIQNSLQLNLDGKPLAAMMEKLLLA